MLKASYFKKSFIFNVLSSIEYTITTNSIIGAVISDSTVVHDVSYNILAKDAVSNVGSLFVIHNASKVINSSPISAMYISQFTYQASVCVECMSHHIPNNMLVPVLGIVGIGKAMSFIVIGSMNAQALARMSVGSIGENYAELSVQSTLASSLGICIGLGLVQLHAHLYSIPVLTVARILVLREMARQCRD